MIEDKILTLVTPIAQDYGVEVLKVSLQSGSGTGKVRVFVDAKGGIDSDVLARISRGLALQLDVEDVIAGKYMLEVTSPGLDWPLTMQQDFDRYEGDWVRVLLEDGQAREGENKGLRNGIMSLRTADGKVSDIDLQDTAKIVRAINWKRVSAKKY